MTRSDEYYRRRNQTLRQRGWTDAKRRQCPGCGRKSALSGIYAAACVAARRCRFCGQEKCWEYPHDLPDDMAHLAEPTDEMSAEEFARRWAQVMRGEQPARTSEGEDE